MTSMLPSLPPAALLAAALAELETTLDPADPSGGCSAVEVLGYGEVSAVLGLPAFPEQVFKRMSGFRDRDAVRSYVEVVEQYMFLLRELGVSVAPTRLVPVESVNGRHVVYVVQPRLAAERFGNAILQRGEMHEVLALLDRVLVAVRRVAAANRPLDAARDRLVGIDAQLSNWYWPLAAAGREALLIDVGTPFLLNRGEVEIGVDVFLCAYPAAVRWWLRRTRAVERYLEDYFDFEPVVVDLLGNFIKEGADERLETVVAWVNDWIGSQPDGTGPGRIDVDAVRRYYARDAATLELSLRLRRLSRFVTTRLLLRRYDFILPGSIRR